MKQSINEIELNGIKYIPKDSVYENLDCNMPPYEEGQSIASRMIGKPVIVRSVNEGVNIGIVVAADETGVELKDCRRLYYHKPKDTSLSWYEGVAASGLSNDSKISGTAYKVIIEDYSMTLCSEEVYRSIMNFTPNPQSSA